MVQTSFPWDKDGTGDKGPYEYTLFGRFLATLYHRDGVFPFDNDGSNTSLQVKQQTVADMSVRVAVGAAFVEGDVITERHLYFNDAFETLTIDDNLTGNDRIDLVILRLDYATQLVRLAVLTGTPAGSPVPPSLQQDATYWEVALAEILVAAGESTSIVTADITQVSSNATLWPVEQGGTGHDSVAAGDILVASAANTLVNLNVIDGKVPIRDASQGNTWNTRFLGVEVIQPRTVLGASAASITLSSIPAKYRDLVLVIKAQSTNAATINLLVQFNSDTGASYASNQQTTDQAGTVANVVAHNATSISIQNGVASSGGNCESLTNSRVKNLSVSRTQDARSFVDGLALCDCNSLS